MIRFLILTVLFFFVSCSSEVAIYNSKTTKNVAKEPMAPSIEQKDKLRSGLVHDKTVWIVTGGLKGEAGLYDGEIAIPVQSLDIDINIIEFLASVDISVSYSQVEQKRELSFRYPAFHGMLLRDFQVKVGTRKFRAVISEKKSAEEVYKLARQRGFTAVKVSQKVFSEMIVNTSLHEKSNIDILFSYTQLSSLSGRERVLAIPEYKGIDTAEFNLDVRGRFISPLTSLSGLGGKVRGNKFSENIKDKNVLKGGLIIKYETSGLYMLSADKLKGIKWDIRTQTYKASALEKNKKFALCDEEELQPIFSYLKLLEMIKSGKTFKEIQAHTVNSRLLTPLTSLLLVDTSK